MTVTVFGIRHHGPGSARSLRRALAELDPDAVLIEGPPDADPLIPLAGAEGMRPPVALLLHDAKQPKRAVFYPFAAFSPEWQAIGHAVQNDVPVRFIDLPAAHVLAGEGDGEGDESDDPEPEAGEPSDDAVRTDPLRLLAEAAGHGDPERWWEDVVEHRRDDLDAFEAIAEAMAAVREQVGAPAGPEAEREERREAWMRRSIRAELKQGRERVAVVCGAWHVPALTDMPPAKRDNDTLKGLPKTKVGAAWVPWTYDRLSYRSGYGAGVTSPGWYDHVFTTGDDVLVRWLARAAQLLRAEDVDVSSAHVIEAARLAEALAVLRDRPLAGLPELTEATRAVLGEGADVALALIHERLVVGEVLGEVPADAPAVPLQADLERQQRRLRMKAEASAREIDLDLRKPNDRERSRLLHRLDLLGIPWGERREAYGKRGTFHELWQIEWRPELAVQLIEASMWGTTVQAAATAAARDAAGEAADLPALARLVEATLVADLPEVVAEVMRLIEDRAAETGDVAGLMDALPPLARVSRYGSVRDTDRGAVRHAVDGLGTRIAVGLPLAAVALDDEAAADLVARIDAVHGAIAVLEEDTLRADWQDSLARVLGRTDVHGRVAGRCARLLYDGGAIAPDEAARRMTHALSPGGDAARAADWIEGFLSGSGLVLLHDQALLRIVDGWVASVGGDDFTTFLPVLRRSVSLFAPAERRQIGARIRELGAAGASTAGRGGRPAEEARAFDEERADAVVPLLGRILGIEGPAA